MIIELAPADLSQDEKLEWYREQEKKIVLEQERLFDTFTVNQTEAKHKRGSLDPELIKKIRRKCKNDLFFLCYSILGNDRLSPNLHGHLCQWMKINKAWRFKEELLPRAHFKSTVITIGDTIQTILPDDDGDQPHPYNLGPNARVLICHEVATVASGYLYAITQHMMSNPWIMALYPECVPTPRKQKINTRELTLPRSIVKQEPTVGTMGVGGRSQGLHYNKFQFDDLIGEEARDSETVMQSAKTWLDGIQGFFDKLAESTFNVIGTRWGPDDIYEHLEERYKKQLKVYRRAVEEVTGYEEKYVDNQKVRVPIKKPIFPEEVSEKDLEVLKANPIVFAAQYLNDPGGGNNRFTEDMLRWYSWNKERTSITVNKSPNFQAKHVHIGDLNKVLIWDPAVTGNSGWCVVGTDHFSRHFVLEARQEALEPTQAVQKMFELYAKYRFRALCVEEVLFSKLFQNWLEAEFRLRGTAFTVIGCKTDGKEKDARIVGLHPFLSNGQIFFNEELYSRTQDKTDRWSDLIYQIIKFGILTKEYHIIDALAYLPGVYVPGTNPEVMRSRRENELKKLEGRGMTGYGKVLYRKP